MPVEEKGKRRLAFCGRCAAVLSILLFVPVVRRFRAHKAEAHRAPRRFPSFGH